MTNMKLVGMIAALVSSACAAPAYQSDNSHIPILSYENHLGQGGAYKWAYETGNGIQAEEQGYLKDPGGPNEGQVAEGCYSYTSPEGLFVLVKYRADDGGFRPKVTHLPSATPQQMDAVLRENGCGKYRPGSGGDGLDGRSGRGSGDAPPSTTTEADPGAGRPGPADPSGYPPNISVDLRLLASRREGKCELDKDRNPIRCYCPKDDQSDEYVPCEP